MILNSLDHAPRSVLIVDESTEARDVLRTILEHRGVTIHEAREARQGLDLARRHQPEVIVLDLEAASADDPDVRRQYDAEPASLVILGSVRRPRLDAESAAASQPGPHHMPKPYHYGPLVNTIEKLLQQRRAGTATSATSIDKRRAA